MVVAVVLVVEVVVDVAVLVDVEVVVVVVEVVFVAVNVRTIPAKKHIGILNIKKKVSFIF